MASSDAVFAAATLAASACAASAAFFAAAPPATSLPTTVDFTLGMNLTIAGEASSGGFSAVGQSQVVNTNAASTKLEAVAAQLNHATSGVRSSRSLARAFGI